MEWVKEEKEGAMGKRRWRETAQRWRLATNGGKKEEVL
jgi:hypothetical protein